MDSCIFCKIANGGIPSSKIWEDERHIAFLDINPVNPGHTLIIPKKHVDSVFDMDEKAYSDLFLAAKRLSGPLKEAMAAKRIGVIIEGFLVPHAHIHLVPINSGSELYERAKKAAPEELSSVAERIRRQI
ncbi:MAG: HIT family protein [Candidatus Micrarchaeota archaeon]